MGEKAESLLTSFGKALRFFRYITTSLSLILLFSFHFSFAGSGVTYHGRLLNPDGAGVTSSSVQFKMQIRTPGTQDCLMYEEIQTIDMSTANGMFALSLGDGTGTRTDSYSANWTLFGALSNRKDFSFNVADCTGATSYTPAADDNRKFRVYFNDGTFAGWEALPLQTINFIPMSIESYAVGGFPASSLLRVEDAGTLGTPSAFTTAQYNEIVALVGGTSSLYTKAGQLNGAALPSLTAGQTITSDGSGGWNATTPLTSESDPNVSAFAKASLPTCASGEVLKADGTSLSCVTDTTGGTPADATDSTKGIASFPSAGGLSVSSGAVSIPDQGSVTPGSYAKVTINQKGLVTAHGTLAESDIPQLTSSGNGVSGGAITSGTIGGSTAINTSGNIATSGAVSSGTFSTRQIDLYDSDNTNYIRLVTPATGDLTSDYSIMLPTSLGSANQVLGMNSAGTALENKSVTAGTGVTITHGAGSIQIAATGSGGTVTSVSGTSPISVATGTSTPVISLDNSGVTAATYGSATQVPVFAVDAKGRVTSVTNTTITGVSPVGSSLTQYQVWVGDGSNQAAAGYFGAGNLRNALGNAQIPGACTSAQTLVWSAITDVFSCTNISITSSQVSDIATNYFKQDGNSFGAAATLGTNDTYALNFETDGSTRMMIDTSGNVGIGTTSAGSPLTVEAPDSNNIVTRFTHLDTTLNHLSGFRFRTLTNGSSNRFLDLFVDPDNDRFGFGMGSVSSALPLSSDINDADIVITASGDVGIGTVSPDSTSLLDITSTTKGVLIPRMTTTQRDAISSPATGLQVYNTTTNALNYYNGSGWQAVGASGSVVAGSVSASSGTAGSPSISFSSDTNTGFYSSGADAIGISAGGSNIFNLSSSGLISATTGGGLVTTADGTAAAPTFSFAGDADTGWFRPAADTLAASTGGSERVRIDSSGNVGIGTATPGRELHINGASTPSSLMLTNDNSGHSVTDGAVFSLSSSGLNVDITNYETGSMGFATNDGSTVAERLTILGSGNVGIGTTNPNQKLHVMDGYGLFKTSTSTDAGILIQSNDQSKFWITSNKTDGNYLNFSTGTSPGSSMDNILVLDGTAGNIGIGISSPTYQLHLRSEGVTNGMMIENFGNSSTAGSLHFKKSNGTASVPTKVLSGESLAVIAASGRGETADFNGSAAKITFSSEEDWTDATAAASMRFFTRPTATLGASLERMRISGSGNVGIGTTSPSSPLHVIDNNSNGIILERTSATARKWNMLVLSDGKLDFYDQTAGSDRMVIDTSGNVGIGTTNPSESLESVGNIKLGVGTGNGDTWLYARPNSTASILYLGNGTQKLWNSTAGTNGGAMISLWSNGSFSPGDLLLWGGNGTTVGNIKLITGDTERIRVTSTGNVGIGTANPNARLNVFGAAAVPTLSTSNGSNPSGSILTVKSDGGNGLSVGVYDGSSAFATWLQSSYMGSSPAVAYNMVLNPLGGNVGIGTTSPAQKLDVWGNIAVSGSTVHTSDMRLKEKIEPLGRSLDKIRALSGYRYHWRDKSVSDRPQIGVIAQEVKEVFPDLVYENSETGYYSVNYEGLIPPLIESTKELYGFCEMSQKQVRTLSQRVDQHDREIASLKRENAEMRLRTSSLQSEIQAKDQEIKVLRDQQQAMEKRLQALEGR